MKKDDQKILKALETGKNNDVLNLLYQKVYPKVKNYIIKNAGSHEEAMDVFQEAVIVFFQHVKSGKFDSRFDIDGFIYSVSRNLWINLAKRNSRYTSVADSWEDMGEFPDFLEKADMEKKLSKEIFEKLGSKCKELLELVIFHDYSMEEVAEKLSFSNRHSAKTQHYKCKQKLMTYLNDHPQVLQKLTTANEF